MNPRPHHRGQRHKPPKPVDLGRLRYYILYSEDMSAVQICKRFGIGLNRFYEIKKEIHEEKERRDQSGKPSDVQEHDQTA